MEAAEMDRLLQKGKRLYGRCLAKADTSCVTGFLSHQLAQPEDRTPLLRAYRAWLHAQADLLRSAARPIDPTPLQLTETLIAEIDRELLT